MRNMRIFSPRRIGWTLSLFLLCHRCKRDRIGEHDFLSSSEIEAVYSTCQERDFLLQEKFWFSCTIDRVLRFHFHVLLAISKVPCDLCMDAIILLTWWYALSKSRKEYLLMLKTIIQRICLWHRFNAIHWPVMEIRLSRQYWRLFTDLFLNLFHCSHIYARLLNAIKPYDKNTSGRVCIKILLNV